MGSLVTRVKSLTNGLNGQIFAAKEIDNKNIVLNILSNIFGEQIEDYVQNCVIRLENNILEKYFNTEVDFAWMSTLNQMVVVKL